MSTVPPPPGRSDDESESSLTGEQLAAFLRKAAEGGAAPKEPSARARMVARRLREEDEAAARQQGEGRKGRGGPVDPPGWRTGPEPSPAPRRRRAGAGAVAGVLLLAAVALVALRPSLVVPGEDGGSDEPPAAETARPTGAPGDPAGSGQATREHPFRGEPLTGDHSDECGRVTRT